MSAAEIATVIEGWATLVGLMGDLGVGVFAEQHIDLLSYVLVRNALLLRRERAW